MVTAQLGQEITWHAKRRLQRGSLTFEAALWHPALQPQLLIVITGLALMAPPQHLHHQQAADTAATLTDGIEDSVRLAELGYADRSSVLMRWHGLVPA